MNSGIVITVLLVSLLPFAAADDGRAGAAKPNILWLTAEDHGPHLGCYGDPDAVTPNLDAFAAQSLRYTRASSNAPICAPARTTLASGVHATSLGAHHMRSGVEMPPWLELIPELLRKEGYYCTNQDKTDYNLAGRPERSWNDSSGKAHYRNRPAGAPFFAVINCTLTHESQLRNENPEPLHEPSKVRIPPYHPDVPETRRDWAQYHDRITQMDRWFGRQLAELEEAGLAEDTIVFFFADHGSGMPRGKRYAGWSGLHVPLLVRIPEKFAQLRPQGLGPGGTSDRLVSFVDFAPTLLSLVGREPRPWHQGKAFLGPRALPAASHSFGFVGRADERPDESRSVTDGHHLYIRNLMPHVPLLKGLDYQMQTPTTRRWKELHEQGGLNAIQAFAWEAPRPAEELYDLREDPHETRNLAAERPELVEGFRKALARHLADTCDLGLLPESIMHELALQHGRSPGDFARSPQFHADALIPPATAASPEGILPLRTGDPAVLAVQLRALVVHAPGLFRTHPELPRRLGTLLDHASPEIRAGAAELLVLDPASRRTALDALVAIANPAATDPFAALHALDALSRQKSIDAPLLDQLRATPTKASDRWPPRVREYVGRLQPIVVKSLQQP